MFLILIMFCYYMVVSILDIICQINVRTPDKKEVKRKLNYSNNDLLKPFIHKMPTIIMSMFLFICIYSSFI